MFNLKKTPVLRIVLIVWVIFATLYVLYGEYNRLNVFVAQRAYTQGITDSVMELMQQAQECKAIPVTAGDARVDLVNIECLKASEEVDAE